MPPSVSKMRSRRNFRKYDPADDAAIMIALSVHDRMKGTSAAPKAATLRSCKILICRACVTMTRFFDNPRLIKIGGEIRPTLATNKERKG